jgi:hypothetical protein
MYIYIYLPFIYQISLRIRAYRFFKNIYISVLSEWDVFPSAHPGGTVERELPIMHVSFTEEYSINEGGGDMPIM